MHITGIYILFVSWGDGQKLQGNVQFKFMLLLVSESFGDGKLWMVQMRLLDALSSFGSGSTVLNCTGIFLLAICAIQFFNWIATVYKKFFRSVRKKSAGRCFKPSLELSSLSRCPIEVLSCFLSLFYPWASFYDSFSSSFLLPIKIYRQILENKKHLFLFVFVESRLIFSQRDLLCCRSQNCIVKSIYKVFSPSRVFIFLHSSRTYMLIRNLKPKHNIRQRQPE